MVATYQIWVVMVATHQCKIRKDAAEVFDLGSVKYKHMASSGAGHQADGTSSRIVKLGTSSRIVPYKLVKYY